MIDKSFFNLNCKEAKFLHNTLLNNISKDVLDTDPVIAGGYLLSVLSEDPLLNNKEKFSSFLGIFRKKYNYGDIDLFYLTNNHKKDTLYSILKKEGFHQLYKSNFSRTYTKYERFEKEGLSTFKTKIVQEVQMKFDSIMDIFSSFDLENCKIAYHKGFLYFTDEFKDAWEKRHLVYNKILKEEESITDMVYQCSRITKYICRYHLDFSISSNQYLLKTFMELDDYDDEHFIDPESVWHNYRGEEEGEAEYDSKYEDLMDDGLYMFLDDEIFGGSNIGYLIDSKNKRVLDTVKSFLK